MTQLATVSVQQKTQVKLPSCGSLQRTCARGQYAAVSVTPITEAPPIVDEVLSPPGQPLDAATRAFMEPRLDLTTVSWN